MIDSFDPACGSQFIWDFTRLARGSRFGFCLSHVYFWEDNADLRCLWEVVEKQWNQTAFPACHCSAFSILCPALPRFTAREGNGVWFSKRKLSGLGHWRWGRYRKLTGEIIWTTSGYKYRLLHGSLFSVNHKISRTKQGVCRWRLWLYPCSCS